MWNIVDQLSVQLTSPNQPPNDVPLRDIVQFLGGNGPTTTWAEEGVANEVAVASVVGDVWRENTNVLTDYVIRRSV